MSEQPRQQRTKVEANGRVTIHLVSPHARKLVGEFVAVAQPWLTKREIMVAKRDLRPNHWRECAEWLRKGYSTGEEIADYIERSLASVGL